MKLYILISCILIMLYNKWFGEKTFTFYTFLLFFSQKAVIILILKLSIKNMKVEGGNDQNS